jgi:Ca2+-dependent lipid-binding protein
MQASLPGFVDAVKIEDFTIGHNALRILSMRALPDQPHEAEYPREEWIDQGDRENALDPNRRVQKKEDKAKKEQEVLNKEGTSPEDEVRPSLFSLSISTLTSFYRIKPATT